MHSSKQPFLPFLTHANKQRGELCDHAEAKKRALQSRKSVVEVERLVLRRREVGVDKESF